MRRLGGGVLCWRWRGIWKVCLVLGSASASASACAAASALGLDLDLSPGTVLLGIIGALLAHCVWGMELEDGK